MTPFHRVCHVFRVLPGFAIHPDLNALLLQYDRVRVMRPLLPRAAALITMALAIAVGMAATLMDPREGEMICAGLKVIEH